MNTLQETISEAVSSKDLTSAFTSLFESCNSYQEYKDALNAISFALYKANEENTKTKKKQGTNPFKYAYELGVAISAIRFEIDEVIKNDKIWRE